MRTLFTMTTAGALAVTAAASDSLFFVGTYTKGVPSEGIYAGRLNTRTGELGAVALAGKAEDPSFLALSPDSKFLYACSSEKNGSVVAFRIDSPTSLVRLNEREAGGKGLCHVSVDAEGLNVLAASYHGGTIFCFPIRADGSLGETTATIAFTGTGLDPKRQQKPYAHSIYTDPQDRFVYACDLGTDSIWTFAFDPGKGTLTPTAPPAAKVPPGGGPRHLALHPDGGFAYANNEMGLSVTAFSRNQKTGILSPIQTVPTLPPGAMEDGVTTAEIQCHPNGKWLYVSNRGHDSIAIFSIGSDGKLTRIGTAPCGVKVPRGFSIDPSGRWLVVGGQNDNRLTVLKIDPASGQLSPTGHYTEVGSPVCVLFPGTRR